MTDISKCCDNKCPSRGKCYRYQAPSCLFQCFSEFKRSDAAIKCSHFVLDKRDRHDRKS